MKFVLWAGAALFAVLLPLYVLHVGGTFPIDFVAFWCAGTSVLAHQNPYLEGSLHACEVSHGLIPALTMPAPYPPYVMPVFAALALVPENVAFAFWCVVLVVATALTAVAIGRLTGLHPALTFGASGALVLLPALPYGQIAPIAICCLAWALVAIREDRPVAAAIALAGAATQPNFALAAWIAAFLCVPRVRVWLIAAGAALVSIATLATGPGTAWMYVTDVLPAHARSEMLGRWQLGLTSLVHAAGVSLAATPAIAHGIFAAAVAIGVFAGIRLRERYGGDHWVVACATALGVAGAQFAHGTDLGFVLPFALMLFAAMPGLWSALLAILLMTPWQLLTDSGGIEAAMAYPFLLLGIDGVTRGRLTIATAALASIVVVSLALLKVTSAGPTPSATAAQLQALPAPPNDALAEVRWSRFNDALGTGSYVWYQRAPVYASFVLLAFVTLRAARSTVRPE